MTQVWSRSCAITHIKNAVEQSQTLTSVLDFFFPKKSDKRPEKSVKFISDVFLHSFLLQLPEKGKDFIRAFLNDGDNSGEPFITQWIEVVHGHKPNSDLHQLLKNSAFFPIFEDLKILGIEIDLAKFYLKLRASFRFCFLEETKKLKGILQIFQCLLYCNTKTKRSKRFCEAVKKLWQKLNLNNDVLNFVVVEESDLAAAKYHAFLEKIVENFQESDNEILIEKIREMYKHDTTTFVIENEELQISSYKIVLSEISKELKYQLQKSYVNLVEIKATEIVLDEDIWLPGKSLSIITRNLSVPFKVDLDLSGINALDKHNGKPAKCGASPGKDGKNGMDGFPGQSSGNLGIKTVKVDGFQNLNIYLNGGNGSRGQDGGNGADGENGKGLEFEQVFGTSHKFKTNAKKAINIITLGSYSLIFGKEQTIRAEDGSTLFRSDSADFLSTHCYRLFKGSDGMPGGKGGRNGLGGEGGCNGEFDLFIDGSKVDYFNNVESRTGDSGLKGNVGENGQPGYEGWDIALCERTGKAEKAFGMNKNEKLEIHYFREEQSDSVFVNDRNNPDFDFQCHAKIVSRRLQRSNLINHSSEKTQETTQNENDKKSVIKKGTPIDQEAAEKKYLELTQSEVKVSAETEHEAEMEYEDCTEVERLYEIVPDIFEDDYQPKKPIKEFKIAVEEISHIINANDRWNQLLQFPIPSYYMLSERKIANIENENVRSLLQKKVIIGKLRNERNNFGEMIFEKSIDNTVSEFVKELEKQYNNLFTKNIESVEIESKKMQTTMNENGEYQNDLITSNTESMTIKCQKLLALLVENGEFMCKKLELLHFKYPQYATAAINTFLMVFESEGMHLDLIALNWIIESIFYFRHSMLQPDGENGNANIIEIYLIPSILVSTSQSDWVDEIFMLTATQKFSLTIDAKIWLKNCIKEFKDENLKLLFCEKLWKMNPLSITENQLEFILEPLKNESQIYPILENLKLPDWIPKIDEYVSKNASLAKNRGIQLQDSNLAGLAEFSFGKLKESFDPKIVASLFPLFANLIGAFDGNKEIIGKLFQRLCSNEIVSGKVSDANLESILQCCLNIQSHGAPRMHTVEIHEIAKELLKETTGKLVRKQGELNVLCENLNKSDQFSTYFETMLSSSYDKKMNIKIEEYYKNLQAKNFTDDFSFEAFTIHFPGESETEYYKFMLGIFDKVLNEKFGYYLRDIQKLAVFNALSSRDKDDPKKMKSVLQQISTGEGKTLIIAALSIILVLKKPAHHRLKVNIVTSSSVLAKREIEAENGCLKLYEAFGIQAGHICHQSQRLRTKIYAKCDIIYGDLTSFQSDFLQHNYLSKNILGDRGCNVVIVDEVDSMLLDNGLNMLYLSHEIAELELLQPIFTKIWQLTNLRLDGDFDEITVDEFYQKVLSSFSPYLSWPEFPAAMSMETNEADEFKKQLITKGIVAKNGKIIITDKKKLKHAIWQITNIAENIKSRFMMFHYALMKENKNHILIPSYLEPYVMNHLKEFIESAESAYYQKEGQNYQIETVSNLGAKTMESKIVIIDCSTGVDLPTTQWTKGLHQFLQLKHGLRFTPPSTKAVYISNVSYLKKYDCIFGFSGTLGAEAEKEELTELYQLNCIKLPSSFPKQFYEMPSIVAINEDKYYKALFNTLKSLMEAGRSALIIGDSVNLVTKLNQKMRKMAEKKLKGTQLDPFKNATVYKRDYEKFEYADGTTPLPPKTIIFSTNLAGRGTDIKISSDLESKGGLHVIVAFLPPNVRIEEQAFGRAARCGEPGTAQIIAVEKEGSDIFELKEKRNSRENKRIKNIKDNYATKIAVEEECFAKFDYELKELKRKLQKKQLPAECYEILCKDIIDQYAMKLDAAVFGDKWKESMDRFCDAFAMEYKENDKGIVCPLQPSNKLKYAMKLAFDKKFDEAKDMIDCMKFPEYSPESKYFSAIFAIKNRNSPALLDSLEKSLIEAKRGFAERLKLYAANVGISDLYRVPEEDEIFFNDDFQQQQQQSEQLTLAVLQSIDEFLGQIVEPADFMCKSLNQESSILVYDNLSNYSNSPITGYKISRNFDEDILKEYCQENGIKFEVVLAYLKSHDRIDDEKMLLQMFDFKNYQEFWDLLKAKNLLDEIRTEFFIDVSKLSSEDAFAGCISEQQYDFEKNQLQYPFVKQWKRLSSTKDIQKYLLHALEKRNIVQKTEFGILKPPKDASEAALSNSLMAEDFVAYGFSGEDTNEILKNEIFERLPNLEVFRLSPKFSWSSCDSLPAWCRSAITKLISQKFAYDLAYLCLINDQAVQLPNITDKTIIFDLMEMGILESNNVNLDALNSSIPGGNIVYNRGSAILLDNNPSQHYNRALTETQKIIQKTFTKAKHHESIVTKISKEQIENVLKEKASAKQKFENLDINFLPLSEVLDKMNLDGSKVKVVSHSLPYLITSCEMKWSKKTLITLGAVGSGAAVQLATGIGLVIVTFGVGAFAGKFLINEGISDAVFCAKTLWKGKSGNFLRYKTSSMALNVALCGITEPIKLLPESAIKIIRRADVLISSGGGILKTLLPSFSKMEKCEKTRNCISDAITFTSSQISARLSAILDEVFGGTEKLQICITDLCKKGEEFQIDGNSLVHRNVNPILMIMFSYAVGEVNRQCIKNSIINSDNYCNKISRILESQKFQHYLTIFHQKFVSNFENICETLKQRLKEHEEEGIQIRESEASQQASKIIEDWKAELQKKYARLVEDKVQRQLSELNNMDFQNQLRDIASETKIKMKKSSGIQIPPQNFIKINNISSKFKTEFQKHLGEFLETINDAQQFFSFAIFAPKIHPLVVGAIAKLIYYTLRIPIMLKVEQPDGTFVKCEAGLSETQLRTKIFIIQQPNGDSSMQNIYHQILQKIPQILTFENFQDALIRIIDESFRSQHKQF